MNHVGGVVHSGWKGTSKLIGKRAVERLTEKFGTNQKTLLQVSVHVQVNVVTK